MDREIQVPPLDFRAAVGAVNDEDRTVELTWSTGADVIRYDWMSDARYIERLSMKPEAVRLQRLNAGAPLLNTHSAWDLADQIGVVEDNSATVNGKTGRAVVRFSKREAVEPFFRDVKDRIIRNVSVGYRVHKFEETPGGDNKLPVRLATDWEPYEISLVPMPADAGAQVNAKRSAQIHTNPCVLVTRENTMDEENAGQTEYVVEQTAMPRMTLDQSQEPNERDLGADQERERISGVMTACTAARLPRKFMQKLIDDKTPLVRAQAMVFEEMGRREDPNGAPYPGRTASASVQFLDDPLVHKRAGIENAILNRVNPQSFKLTDEGREYRGMSMLDIAKAYLNAVGVRTTQLSRMELAGVALGQGFGVRTGSGYHTTSDFPLLLADVANKTLAAAYGETPQTYRAIARQANLPDFKPVYRNMMGDAPQLLLVPEHGEFKRGTIGEARETYQLATYGRIFAVTRQALINDDLDAFARVPSDFGRESRNLESNLAWEQITSNPTMGDGVALFSTTHGNYDPIGSVISITSLGAGRAALRGQRGLGTADQPGHRLNLAARFLIVPTGIETVADQFVTQITAGTSGAVNPFAGRLTVIAEPRLEDVVEGDVAWYLAVSPDQLPVLEYGYLEGQEGPTVETQIGFNVDGVEMKCRLDFAAKVVDYRGIYKNGGEAAT